jgi:beta-glucanase (GH16 family)
VQKGNLKKITKRLLQPLLIISNFIVPLHAGWETQWIERFDGAGINLNNWTPQIQANYNNEVQCYTDDDSTANKNYDISNGTLKIISRRQAIACPGLGGAPKSWTSGRINSKDKQEFLYGRIESRIRFLNDEGGTWPAFWMLENRIAEDPKANDNDFVNWPNPGAGEIDVWEWFSNSPNTYITNFFNASSNCGSLFLYDYPNGGADVKQWHDYAIEWDANAIKFYIDDIMVKSHNISSCSQYKEPMFILLNVAMGGILGGNINPALNLATMEIDYVAHCNLSNANSASRCNEATPTANVTTDDLTIFSDFERSDWPAWDSNGGTSPTLLIDDDPFYAEAMEFTINGSTVVGFTSRAPDANNGIPYDASGIAAMGTLEFDLKMITSPGTTDWKLKLESVGVATEAEVNLSSSIEGHAEPLLNIWLHYSFNLSTLATFGLDLSNIDLLLVFPEFGTGDGAVYRIDNVRFRSNLPQATPVITSDAINEVVINNAYNYTLTATDADGDDLTLAAPILPQWLSFNSTTGILSGTPTTANIGVHNVSLTVDDGTEQTIQAFSIMVSLAPNTAPSITSQADPFITPGVNYVYTLQGFDADGDDLTLAAPILPQWLSFNSTTGILSGTPTTADIGAHNVSLTVDDGTEQAIQTFSFIVSLAPNTAPSITSQAERFVAAGVTYSYRVQVFDAEGDTLTLSLTSAPDWLTLDNASGILSGTPTNANVGGHDVNVMVSDGSNSVTQNFRITVRAVETSEQTVSSSGGGSLGLWMLLMVMAVGIRKPMSRRNCLKR